MPMQSSKGFPIVSHRINENRYYLNPHSLGESHLGESSMPSSSELWAKWRKYIEVRRLRIVSGGISWAKSSRRNPGRIGETLEHARRHYLRYIWKVAIYLKRPGSQRLRVGEMRKRRQGYFWRYIEDFVKMGLTLAAGSSIICV